MGTLSKNNAKIGGLKLKLLLLQGGPNFHFMSCTFVLNCMNNSTCIVKRENVLRKCEVYVKKCHHILDMLPEVPSKRIDLCHEMSIILVSITRPNSSKNITCHKKTIFTQMLSYKTVVSSPSGAEVPDNLLASLGEAVSPAKVACKHALCVFEVNKCRVSQSTVQSENTKYVRLKVLCKWRLLPGNGK